MQAIALQDMGNMQLKKKMEEHKTLHTKHNLLN